MWSHNHGRRLATNRTRSRLTALAAEAWEEVRGAADRQSQLGGSLRSAIWARGVGRGGGPAGPGAPGPLIARDVVGDGGCGAGAGLAGPAPPQPNIIAAPSI